MNPKKWVIISFTAAAIVTFLVFRQLLGTVWDYFRLPAYQDWVVTLPDLLAVLVGIGTYLLLKKNKKADQFMTEVVVELSKVTYPVKKETAVSTVVVIIMVGIASVILFLFDTVWGTATQKFLTL